MQKIIPCLWFDNQAGEAANFYTSIFGNSKVLEISRYGKSGPMPEGTVLTVNFELDGVKFTALNGGPTFKFNPSISFHARCATKGEVDALWEKLLEGGRALMELGEYPFSERYGWLEDRYGLSWQLIYAGDSVIKQRFVPVLMFVGDVCGKAENALDFYTSLFSGSKAEILARYGKDEEPDKEGTIKYSHFTLGGQEFGAMDSAWDHQFAFNEAISFMIYCDTQEEIDYFWDNLSANPKSEQCGWLKDKYGVSWQIVPSVLGKLIGGPDPNKSNKVMEAILKMKKLDIETLKQAYENG